MSAASAAAQSDSLDSKQSESSKLPTADTAPPAIDSAVIKRIKQCHWFFQHAELAKSSNIKDVNRKLRVAGIIQGLRQYGKEFVYKRFKGFGELPETSINRWGVDMGVHQSITGDEISEIVVKEFPPECFAVRITAYRRDIKEKMVFYKIEISENGSTWQ